MVLFENLKLGSRVQTNLNGWLVNGTVRYLGELVGVHGDWVGVELEEPVGDHSGLFRGRQYFQCNAKHGIFIQPRKLHLLGNWRTMSANRYKTITKASVVDETLFSQKGEKQRATQWSDPVHITSSYSQATEKWSPDSLIANIENKRNFHKKHLVGRTLSPSKSTVNEDNHPGRKCSVSHKPKQVNTFTPSSPSIPNIHVPRPVLKRMVREQYFGTSLPRYNTLY